MRNLSRMMMLGLLTSIAPVSAGPMLVIASNVPAYEFGAVIDGARAIRLDEGFLTLIAANGERVQLEGPVEGLVDPAPAQADPTLIEVLSHLIQSELEAERSAPATLFAAVPRVRPDSWSADATRSGVYCVPTEAPTLWRSHAKRAATLQLKRQNTESGTSTPWPAGKSTIAWPQSLVLADGATYELRLSGAVGRTELTMRLIPEGLATDAHRIAWMAKHGCRTQALLVLDSLAAGD
jgi:hypothetical protein